MTHIGFTGHQDLPGAAIGYIGTGIREVLQTCRSVVGYTSLAAGADQLFAHEVLAAGGQLCAVIPCTGYETTLSGPAGIQYHRLLAVASRTIGLPFPSPSEEAYLAAGMTIVEHSEMLIAVWDGRPARGPGGTADIVGHARDAGLDVHIVWPAGCTRN